MNWIKIIGGTLLLIFFGMWLYGNQGLLNISRHGVVVKMRIVDKPRYCIGTKTRHNMKLSYRGKYYSHEITLSDCDKYNVGDSIEMRYLEGSEDILYPRERISMEYQSVYVMAGLSVVLIVYGIFSKPSQG